MLTHQVIGVQAVLGLALAAEPETAADSWKTDSSAAEPEQTKKAKEAVEIELKLEAEVEIAVEQV
jgi:hypothetical protein